MWKSGVLPSLNRRGLAALASGQLKGATGPSLLLRVNAANHPDKTAIVFGDRTWSYAELDRRSDRLADGLRRRHGLDRRSAAVLVMRNRPEAIEIQHAMSRLGGHAVPVSWRSTANELEYLVNHSEAKVVFVEAALADAVLEARSRFANVPEGNIVAVGGERDDLVPYDRVIAAGNGAVRDARGGGAVVIYTSGTTGKPKGAVRKFPREAIEAVFDFIGETPIRNDDRHLVVAPMYHSTAFAFLGFTFLVGGTVVIGEFDPEGFLANVARHRITTSAVVPTMLHRILQLPDEVIDRYDTRSLRAIFSGGAPLSGTLARRFIERFGPVLYNFYGATETGLNTLATPEELLASPGTIGHAIPGNDIRLLDDAGNEVPRGQSGELFVRNAMLVAGYHRDEAATRGSMRDGYFSVGDLAHQDENGLYHIDGRKRDMIISGGVNVYPVEVEEVLSRYPAVGECAVVGVPDEEWGERVRAFVVARQGHSLDTTDLIAWTKRQLAGAKIPRDIVVLDELPKNPTGKVLKRELRGHR